MSPRYGEPIWWPLISTRKSLIKMLKSKGLKLQPCFKPIADGKSSDRPPGPLTQSDDADLWFMTKEVRECDGELLFY